VQAKDKKILTLLNNCETEPRSITDVYVDLYDHLVKKNIITTKVGAASLWSWDSIYTINKALIEESDLRKLLKKEDLPKAFKCYTINYEQLSKLLKNYNYNFTDEVKVLGELVSGKQRNRSNRRRMTKRKTNRRTRRA
jgi:hypothetical protein